MNKQEWEEEAQKYLDQQIALVRNEFAIAKMHRDAARKERFASSIRVMILCGAFVGCVLSLLALSR